MRIVWLEDASRDLDAILDYIEQHRPRGALAMALAIRGQMDTLLGEHPRIGRSGRIEGTRELVITRTPYLVIYRVRDDRVDIIRVLHGAQQWPADD